MPERPGDHELLQLRRRCCQTQEPLAELHQLQVIVLRIGHDLARQGPFMVDFPGLEPRSQFNDLPLDERDVRVRAKVFSANKRLSFVHEPDLETTRLRMRRSYPLQSPVERYLQISRPPRWDNGAGRVIPPRAKR